MRSRDREVMKAAQQEVKRCVREVKDSYRRKVEQRLRDNNMREVWEGLRTITVHNTRTRVVGGTMERANKLNDFFNRFNQPLSPQPLAPLRAAISPSSLHTPPPRDTTTSPLPPPPPHHNLCHTSPKTRGQRTAEKASAQESSRPGQSVSKTPEDLCCRTGGTNTADLQP